MSLPTSALASTQQEAGSDLKRPCASFAPSRWGDTFLQYASLSMEVNDNVMQQARILKEEMKITIQSSNTNIMEKLNIIDFIQRFGISYHFQKEINQALEQFHDTFAKNGIIISDGGNHHFVSLLFRLLRQQGYQISSSGGKNQTLRRRSLMLEIGWLRLIFGNWPYPTNLTIALRECLGQLIVVISLLDDTYDAYGTVQELELFTQAIQRWDTTLVGSLPHCMKVVFDTVLELCDELELATTENGKSIFVVPYFKQAVINLTKAYMVEAKWCHAGYVPTYDEYKVNGIWTSAFSPIITPFIGLGKFATENVFNWIGSDPKIIEAVSIIGRVLNDMASHEFERQRVHVASAVECCMKQYDISQVEAYNLIHNDVEDYWKIINEEYLKTNDIPKSVLDCVINLARMSEVSYENHQDKYTNEELLKDCVSSLLLEPMCLDQQ